VPTVQQVLQRMEQEQTSSNGGDDGVGGGGATGAGLYPTLSRPSFDPKNVNSAVEFVWQLPATSTGFSRPSSPPSLESSSDVSGGSGKGGKALRQGPLASPLSGPPSEPEVLAATAEVLSVLLEEPCFKELRTNQQLGYIVFSGLRSTDGVASFVVIVQSAQYDAVYLHQRVSALIADLDSKLFAPPPAQTSAAAPAPAPPAASSASAPAPSAPSASVAPLTEASVRAAAQSCAVKRSEAAEKRLLQQVGRHWEEVQSGTLQWDRRARERAAFALVDLERVRSLYRRCVGPFGSDRRVVAYHIQAAQAPAASTSKKTETETETGEKASKSGVVSTTAATTAPPPPSSMLLVKDLELLQRVGMPFIAPRGGSGAA